VIRDEKIDIISELLGYENLPDALDSIICEHERRNFSCHARVDSISICYELLHISYMTHDETQLSPIPP
jgi:hypothetical protein